MAIRQAPTAVLVPQIVTGSAYAPRDVVGQKFEIPLAVGSPGGWVGAAQFIDIASGNMALRAHMYSREPSAYATGGVAYTLAIADEDAYLGYIDFPSWVSAGASKMIAQKLNPSLPIMASGGTRSIWCVVEAPNGGTFGDSANPLRYKQTVVQDYG